MSLTLKMKTMKCSKLLQNSGLRHTCGTRLISSGRDYQYLEQSDIATFKYQSSLPQLTVPDLDKTVTRYLQGIKPLIVSEKQYSRTVKTAEDFAKGEGRQLQEALLNENARIKPKSYIIDAWSDMYLKSRCSLVLNFNPVVAFTDEPDRAFNAVPVRVTNLVISAMRFRRSLVEEKLTPEFSKPKKREGPLDMTQFGNLFASTRVPKKDRDELVVSSDSKHIAVLKNGQFFAVDVLDRDGNLKSPIEIFSLINYIHNLEVDGTDDSITSLSTEDRDLWASVRSQLVSSTTNATSLSQVDSAQFVVCLDDIEFNRGDEICEDAHNTLHGNSSKQHIRPLNRWFDKNFSLIFDRNGHVALSWEHSWGDGVTIMRLFNDIDADSKKNHFASPDTKTESSVDPSQEVRHLRFKLDPAIQNVVNEATAKWREFTEKLSLSYTNYDKMTKDYFKAKKLSPDSMFQFGFQLAYFKLYGATVPTYEACSTSAFRYGRTEVIRSCTNETKAAVAAFSRSHSHSPSDLRQLLENCSKKHSQIAKEASMAEGFDRHLLGLKITALRLGNELPEFYNDPSYSGVNNYILSTSALNSAYFGFAPVVDDGYGLGYGVVDSKFRLLCSSYKGQRDSRQFVDALDESLDLVHEVLEKF